MSWIDDIQAVINGVWALLQGMVSSIQTSLGNAVAWIQDKIGFVVTAVGNALSGLVNDIVPKITALVGGVVDALSGIITPLLTKIQELYAKVSDTITTLLGKIETLFTDLWGKVQEVVTKTLDSIAGFFTDLTASVQAAWDAVIAHLESAWETITTTVKDLVSLAIQTIKDTAKAITDTVSAAIKPALDAVRQSLKETSDLISAEWKELVTGAETIIDSVNDRIGGMAKSVTDAAGDLTGAIGRLTDEQVRPFVESVTTFFDAVSGVLDPKSHSELESSLAELTAPNTLEIRGTEGFTRLWQTMMPKNPIGKALFLLAFSYSLPQAVWAGVVDANAQVVLQAFSAQHPWQLLPVAEAIAAHRLGRIDKDELVPTLKAAGYADPDIAIMANNAFGPLAPSEVLAAWNRGELDDTAASKALRANGLEPDAIKVAFKLAKIIPPVQDIITMAVREVWSPTAEQYGQFNDLPPKFVEWAGKQGLTEEWAKNYWAAHWSLPSPQQAFEMYHRGVIESKSELEDLLAALDVMPHWRDKMVAIAYNPFTRVDIRRMHKVGVLKDEELEDAYKKIGYAPLDASRLAEFTIALNTTKTVPKDEELGKLTRGAIVGFYSDGLIPKERAVALLVGIGVTQEAAALYLSSADATSHRSERKAQTAHIVELAIAGTITRQQAEDQLRSLGLEQVEIERALTTLLQGLERKQRQPTLAQATQFLQAGLIQADEFLTLAQHDGYSARWAGLFLKLAEAKHASAKKS